MKTQQTLYDRDFYAWSKEQATIFKARQYDKLDWHNLLEEIESMGKSEYRELESRLIQLLTHLLKWKYQPQKNYGRSWLLSIQKQRAAIEKHLKENPSLKREIEDILQENYSYVVKEAMLETELPKTVFPEVCEWTINQILDEGFFPE